jgi:nucleotide-binding universal stress UspA family protein
VVTSNDVVGAIAGHASEHSSDLVVLGTRGLGLDAVGRLGSVSLGVTNRIAIPVLLVPPAVWISYAKS